jgi:hypothetical protein
MIVVWLVHWVVESLLGVDPGAGFVGCVVQADGLRRGYSQGYHARVAALSLVVVLAALFIHGQRSLITRHEPGLPSVRLGA